MQYDESPMDPLAFKWLAAVTCFSMAWGMFAGWVAFRYGIPLDVFALFVQDMNLYQSLVLGLVYGLVASFFLVILASLGFYNPVLAFVVLLAGIIMFFDFVFGKMPISDPKNLFWLMALPMVVIRDVVTWRMLRNFRRIEKKDIDDGRKEPAFDGGRSQASYFD